MAFDPVPWFIGGGAEHSPEVARLLAHAATGGAEGIVEVADLRVVPLDVPGTAVQVLAGGALIRNRAAGGTAQSYVARNASAETVPVAATGSGSGRSDLVVVQIEDPNMPGEPWAAPTDRAAGPYVFARVIPNVPPGTMRLQDVPGYAGRSAVTLARIDIPASTGTITDAMIVDLRRVALPRTQRVIINSTITQHVNVTSSNFTDWPDGGVPVEVPEWATAAAVRIETLAGHIGPNVLGELRIMFGGQGVIRTAYNLDLPAGQSVRVPIVMAGQARITSSAGESRQLRLQARRTAGTGYITSRSDTYYVFDIEFMEMAA